MPTVILITDFWQLIARMFSKHTVVTASIGEAMARTVPQSLHSQPSQSGTPQTTIYTLYAVTSAILNGRGDLGRTEMFTETDFSVNHRYKFGRDNRFTLEPFVDITNLFDEKNTLGVDTTISSIDLRAANLAANGCTTCGGEAAVFQTIFNGPGIQTYVNNYLNNPATSIANRRRNTYGLANNFQVPRGVRFGVKVFF